MSPLAMFRAAGPAAYAAVFFGALGALIGLVALVATLRKSGRAARSLGITALVLGAFSASIGVVGMKLGIAHADAWLASQSLGDVLHERIRIARFLESQRAVQIAFASALLPLAFGALAALIGARKTRAWGLPIGALLLALGATGGALACSLASAHPQYPYDPYAPAPWDLVAARDRTRTDMQGGCDDLDQALDESRQSSLDPTSILPDARELATKCAKSIFVEIQAAGGTVRRAPPPPGSMRERRVWTPEALLDSPLLVDDDLRRDVKAYAHTTLL